MCTSYKSAYNELYQSLAATARRLCTCFVVVSVCLACRLIALSKNPGVRPIGIGETVRRIIAKSVLSVIRGDIQDAAGTVQLCAGRIWDKEVRNYSAISLAAPAHKKIILIQTCIYMYDRLHAQR